MYDKIFWGIYLLVFTIALLLVAYKIGYKYMVQEKRCTAKTKGIVYKYTIAERGGDGVHLPIVRYTVNNKTYKVTGPEFRAYITTKKSSPAKNNQSAYEIDEKKQILRINRTANSMASIYSNPLEEMYPIDSSVDVFYDPNNPKLAYVERYCNNKFVFWLCFISGIICFFIMIAILIFL